MIDSDDPEIAYAAALGAVLSRMRAELDETAVKRVMTFILSRHGIRVTELYVVSSPPAPVAKAPIAPAPAEEAPAEELQHTRNSVTCPLCGWSTITDKGLNLHMYHKHGTTLKEHARQHALNGVAPEETT